MREVAASPAFAYRLCSTPDAERRRQLEDFEELIEKLIERSGRAEKELREVKDERDRLREEVERLKGE